MADTELFDNHFFERLNTLKMSVDMRLTQGMAGNRKSAGKGSSAEFSDFREYVPGDDIRRIDWNAYGRTDKLYIKQYMEEKEGLYQIFVDTSRSMLFGEAPKSVMALRVAGALSYIILGNLDRVSISQLKENARIQGKGMAGAASFFPVLEQLKRVEFDGRTALAGAVLSRPVPIGGASILISDFLDPAGIADAMKYLAFRRQSIVLVQILAKEELEIGYEGTINLQDMETGEKLKVTMTNAAVRQYGQALETLKAGLRRLAHKYHASYIFLRSDEDLAAAMLHGFSGLLRGIG